MNIHPQTIHFDDRPWSVRGYVYGVNIRYRFTVPEDLIFEETGKSVLDASDMIAWANRNISRIERCCADYVKRRESANRPLNDSDDIIIVRL